MKKVTTAKYAAEVKVIYSEHPTYKTGHDGSDGQCDCIGMVRGALIRAGADPVKGLSGTNYAARHTIINLVKMDRGALCVGDVVLKTRPADDKDMPLPDRYRKGGADYNEKWGETNFTHIGTVTSVDPLNITHMTSPTAQIDTKVGNWKYYGELPQVTYTPAPDPEPEPVKAYVVAATGSTVNLRKSTSVNSALVDRVPIGSEVEVLESFTDWSFIRWKGKTGYMMTKFLDIEGMWTVHIPNVPEDKAAALLEQYPGSWKTK